MVKRSKTELPLIEVNDFKNTIEDAATILLQKTKPNKKVVKQVVKTFIEIGETQFKIDGFFSWQDKRNIMNRVFQRIS